MKKLIIILSTLPLILHGRIDDLHASSVWRKVNESCLSVILFYNLPKPCKDPCKRDSIKQLKHRFCAIAANKNFNYARVRFYMVNASCSPQLLRELDISSLPALQAFSNGKPTPDHAAGDLRELEMHEYIEHALGSKINSSVKERNKYDQKVEDAKLSAYANSAYFYPGWGYGYGYGGFGYGGFYGRRFWW